MLAFTRHEPVTCVVELDGVQSDTTTRFYRAVWKEFEAREIPFTLHWGKVNDHLSKARVRKIYGEQTVARWIELRVGLLGDRMCEVLSNSFMYRCGLAGL